MLVAVDPELEPGAALAAVDVVGRREPRVLDRHRAVLVEQRRPRGLAGVRGARRPHARHRQPVAGVGPGRDRPRGLDALPVRLAPAMAALAEAADLHRPPARAHRAGDAAQLLVALHPAGARDRVVAGDQRGRGERLEAQLEAVLLALHRHGPVAQRLGDAHPQPADRDRLPARAVLDLEAALGDRGHRLAPREQHGERAAAAAGAVLARRDPDPRQPVELGGGVAERERHRIRERRTRRGPDGFELCAGHVAGRWVGGGWFSPSGGASTAVPSTS